MNLWIALGLVVFGLAVTFVTRWLVARLRHQARFYPGWPMAIGADLLWVVLLFAAGILAPRYAQRLSAVGLGYVLYGLGALLLSFLRASLYQRLLERRGETPWPGWQAILHSTIHNLVYVLFAISLYLFISWLAIGRARLGLFIAVGVGALLPDLDSRRSPLGRLLPFLSRRLEDRLGACRAWHSLAANALVAAVTALLIPLIGVPAWGLIGLGFLSHLFLDLLRPRGIMLLWPLSRARYVLSRRIVRWSMRTEEWKQGGGLAAIALVLLLVVDLGPPVAPPPPRPSFEQSLEQYLSLRGRTLVFADVEGTWQATARRVANRFEILNAAGESLIMLDRYTGQVFIAGQGAADDLYLNRIAIVQGSGVNIKPVEIRLADQFLGEALPTVYQMQPEPGLQHIFVSGDVVVPPGAVGAGSPLETDYSQTELRRIVSRGEGHYRLEYLTAADLIALAGVHVDRADLLVVATYASPPAGPTATPLPEPTPVEELP
jgi:hypothetical protein